MYNYNYFLCDREFERLTNQIFRLVEDGGRFTGDNTYEWDLTKNNNSLVEKLKKFLEKLSKEKVREYFIKFLDKIKLLPERIRRKVLINYSVAFLSVVSMSFLTNLKSDSNINNKVIKEFIKVNKKSSFEVSHKFVSNIEGEYSDDKSDIGNYVTFKLNQKEVKRFIGTKYGISAPVLMKYLGHLPKKEDMINLSYETALKIYKEKYWNNPNIENFCNQSIANLVYDGCVNQGIGGMKEILRKVLIDNGVKVNDEVSPFNDEFIKMINSFDQVKTFDSIKKYREVRYKNTKTADKHVDGWLNRLAKLKYEE